MIAAKNVMFYRNVYLAHLIYIQIILQLRCIMNTVRMNITLPLEIAEILKNVKNKSSFIAEAVRERFEREEKENLIKELSEGYKVRKKEDTEISLEWDTTSGDGID